MRENSDQNNSKYGHFLHSANLIIPENSREKNLPELTHLFPIHSFSTPENIKKP